MKKLCGKSTEHIVYYIGILTGILGILILVFSKYGHFDMFGMLPPCIFHSITGLPCPGCGCTRAMRALAHFDLIASIRYNPIIFYIILWYGLYMLTHTIEFLHVWLMKWVRIRPCCANKKETPSYKRKRLVIQPRIMYVYIGLIILFLQWFCKLLLMLTMHITF